MKKLLQFVLCISCWTQSFSQSEINLTPEQEEEAWEYFIQRFFPLGYNERYYPAKFKNDIRYYLINNTKSDSITLKKTIDELDDLIPNNISYARNKQEANFIIEIFESDKAAKNAFDEQLGDFHSYHDASYNYTAPTGEENSNKRLISQQHHRIVIPDSLQISQQKNRLIFTAVTGLTYDSSQHIPIINTETLRESSSIFSPKAENLSNGNFPELHLVDKFYIKKLYAPDLDSQVRSFLIENYGLWYYINFRFHYSLFFIYIIKFFIISCYVFLVLFLFYKLKRKGTINRSFNNYLLHAVNLFFILAGSIILYTYLPVYTQGTINLYYHPKRINLPSFSLFTYIFSGLIISSLILFVLEKILIKNKNSLIKNFSVRTFSFLCLSIVVLIIGQITLGSPFYLFFFILVIFGIIRSLFFYIRDRNEALLRKKDVELSQLKASKAEAEVASLHARINPHFLYNSLNSIAGLAHIDADKTERMALSLSDLFRHNLNRKNNPYCTIYEEIEASKAYMEIEQIRFGDKLQFSTEIDERLYEYLIPRNIIQPLLENAIKHGVSQLNTTGKIKLKVIEIGENIEISVYDNGPAFQEGSISGYGLQSIFDILNLTYKNKAELYRENTAEKRVWICISKNELKKAAQ